METESGSPLPDTAEGLLFLLKAPGQELKRLLNAAQRLLESPQYLVPRKTHFLLDWTTNLLIKTSTRHTDPDKASKEGVRLVFLDPAVWRFFESLLKNENVQDQVTINPKLVAVVDNVFQHLHYRHSNGNLSSQDEELAESVAQIFNFIFQHYSNLLRPKFEQFTQTLASISSLALKFLSKDLRNATIDETSKLVHSFLVVLATALKVYRQLCFDALTPNKIFTAVVEELLANFLGILDLISKAIQSTSQQANISEDFKYRLTQVTSLLEKTIQHALFGAVQMEEFHSAFSPSIAYGQDCFMLMNKKNKGDTAPPIAKRSKTGKASDMAPKFENEASVDVSKSYSKRLFDWLLTHSKGSDAKAELILSSIPFLFRLCVTNIFSARGRFASSTSEASGTTTSSLGLGPSDTPADQEGENDEISAFASDTVALMSQRTMKVLWSMFAAFQRICVTRVKADITSSKADVVKNTYIYRAITSNTLLLSIIREYDIYSHSQQGISDRSAYLAAHVADFVKLVSSHPGLDAVYGSFRVLLELDQTFIEDYLGPLLQLIWVQPSNTQIESDAFCATLIHVYGLLRQIDVLITRILEQLHSATIVGFFGAQFWASLEKNFELLPYGLIVPIFNIFLEDMKKNYVAKLPNISTNVVHAEALFNHFLENLKLSPSLATELCQQLDASVKLICGPLLDDFLKSVKKYHSYEDEKTNSKKLQKIVDEFQGEIPKHVQAGLALFHIFVTFENYCKNRFFPSHNTPDNVSLTDEALPPFSKLDSSVRLDHVCHFIQRITGQSREGKSSHSKAKLPTLNAFSWRFRSVLFNTALQRSVKLYKIVGAIPPANLPALVRRHAEVKELKDIALEEFSSLLIFLHSEFASFSSFYDKLVLNMQTSKTRDGVSKETEISDSMTSTVAKSNAQVSTSWQVDSEDSFWLYIWDSLCTHVSLVVSPQAPLGFASGFVQKLVQLQYYHSKVVAGSTEQTSVKLFDLLHSSTLKCWINASFYEIEGARQLLVPTIVKELFETLCDEKAFKPLHKLLDGSSSSLISKTAKTLEEIQFSGVFGEHHIEKSIEIMKLLNSLPNEMWTLDDVRSSLSPLLVLLNCALRYSASETLVISLLTTLTLVIQNCSPSRYRVLRATQSSESETLTTPSKLLLHFFDLDSFLSNIVEKAFPISPRQTAAVLASLVEQMAYDHTTESKAAKFIKKTFSSLKTQAKESLQYAHLLDALITGLLASFQARDEECAIHMEWIRTNQRNNVGWKAPPTKNVVFGAAVQKVLSSLQKLVKSMVAETVNDLKEQVSSVYTQPKDERAVTPETIAKGILTFHSFLSLLDIARLQRGKLTQFLDKKGGQSNTPKSELFLAIPEHLNLSTLLALIRWNFASPSISSEMDVDLSPHEVQSKLLVNQISFQTLAALSRCLPVIGKSLSEEDFSLIVSTWYTLLLDPIQSNNASNLLRVLVPRLSPFQCRFLLSHLNYELHKVSSRDKTSLAVPAWETELSSNDRARTLHILIEAFSIVLPLIDASVAYDVLSQYSSRLILTLCSILESSFWPSLSRPLDSKIHSTVVSLITQLIGDKFVELSGAELNTASELLGVVLAKHHTIHSAPLLLQISKDLNLSVPLSTWSSIVLFTPEVFTAYYHLLSTILHARPIQMSKNIANLILQAKILLYAAVLRTSPSRHNQLEALDVTPLKKIHAEYVGRLYKDLANLGPFMRSFAVHILIDYVMLLERESVSQPIRAALNPGIYAMVELLEENEQNLILKSVNATGKSIFRQMHAEYERDHKYQGKA